MDFDFMCLKSLDEIKTNFFGGEDSSTVGNRIMGFSHDGIGHFVLDSYLRYFASIQVFVFFEMKLTVAFNK